VVCHEGYPTYYRHQLHKKLETAYGMRVLRITVFFHFCFLPAIELLFSLLNIPDTVFDNMFLAGTPPKRRSVVLYRYIKI